MPQVTALLQAVAVESNTDVQSRLETLAHAKHLAMARSLRELIR
jgi:hypothetical protein